MNIQRQGSGLSIFISIQTADIYWRRQDTRNMGYACKEVGGKIRDLLTRSSLNRLADDKILGMSKLEESAYNFTVPQMVQFFFDRVEKFFRKDAIAGYQHFLLFVQCF